MEIVKGWRRIDNQRGYVNATTGQNLIIAKTEFGEQHLVMLFPIVKKNDEKGRKISPEYASKSKAEAFAVNWMNKHINGAE
jgi:hypothetical protein